MRFLIEPDAEASLEGLGEYVAAVERAGLDGLFLPATQKLPAPLVTAAAVAAMSDALLLAAEVVVGDRHPIEVAEEAAVVDQASKGRLILVAAPAVGFEAHFDEAVELIRLAGGARPFRFEGTRWRVPVGGGKVRVTPAPFGPRLEIWQSGPDRPGAARAVWTDPDTLVEQLTAEQADWAIVRSPVDAVGPIGRSVRPRLALDRLPVELEREWRLRR